MMGLVDIVLPSGEQATVPQEDLSQAQAAGARVPTEHELEQQQVGGLFGQAATAAIGAGRTATMGLSDIALTEGADLTQGLAYDLGIEQTLRRQGLSVDRHDMAKVLSLARDTNKYSDMAGEAAGLFMGPVPAVGEVAEAGTVARLGEGLLGKVASMGARGAAEGALIGAQHEISEETLGDAGLNGQKVFAAMPKDALLNAGAGAALGAGGHYLGELGTSLRSTLSKARGPVPDATLDAIAGVEGAGRAIQQDARASEDLIESLRKAGATSEQAAKMADEIDTLSRTTAASGPVSGLMKGGAEQYIANRAADNLEMGEALRKGLVERTSRLAQQEEVLNSQAARMSRDGTTAMRKLEGTLDELQFTSKPEQMAKLVDPARLDVQRDMAARLIQDVDDTLKFWESTAAKGGSEGAVKSLRKTLTDAENSLAKIGESGSETASRDLFIRTDKLKRAVDRVARYGEKPFGLPEAVMHEEYGFRTLGDKMRGALEDESVWGQAGSAQREWNGSFSEGFARRQAFERDLGVSIDRTAGVPVPEVDFAKTRGMLNSLSGGETDALLQPVKNTESWIAGQRDRLNALEKYADISAKQKANIAEGRAALDTFEKTFGEARKEAAVVNRLKQMQLEEQGKTLGGIAGLVSDLFTSPAKTVERFASVIQATEKVEKAIAGGLEKFFGQKGKDVVEALKPRPKAEVVKELGEVRSLAGNMAAMQERAAKMVGDLTKYAPETAKAAQATAVRAMIFLAQEAPTPGGASMALVASKRAEPRYSDQQISEWETKRRAALDPQSVVDDMRRGKINREAIRTIEFVSPALFADIQRTASDYVERLRVTGKLDKMPYQQQASLATLLKVPADGTWRPDFIAMMQAAKATPAPSGMPASAAPVPQFSKRAIKMDTKVYATEAQAIEGGGVV